MVDPLARQMAYRMSRHAAISANVANADTPGYSAVDVSFSAALEGAGLRLATTHANHLGGQRNLQLRDRLQLSGGEPRRDGNDVDIDAEMVKLARNQIEYQFLTRRLGGKFQKIKEAISGRTSP
jgi:flagellar basal-body rod protein FlgB